MTASIQVLTTDELRHMPKPEWLIEEFVAQNSTTVIYGEWGVGKSFLTLDMVLSATTGAAWLGGRAVARPLKTLYIVAEGAAWWANRIDAFEAGRMPIDEDMVVWIPEPVALYDESKARTPDGVRALEGIIEKHRPDILVIDTWVRCTSAFGMDENSAGDTAKVIRELDRLRDNWGVSPVIVHHPSRAGELRGSGNLLASVERVIRLEAVKKGDRFHFNVKDEKGNHIQPFKDFQVQIDDIAWEHEGELRDGAILREGVFTDTTQMKPDSNDERIYVFLQENPGPQRANDIIVGAGVPPGSVNASLANLVGKGFVEKVSLGIYQRVE